MNYKSPVDLIVSEMNLRMEGEILKAVQNVGVNVDKDELIKALKYDRDQYQKGYADRDAEIVRCKDCINMKVMPCDIHGHIPIYCTNLGIYSEGLDWFCADGERKE